MLAIVLSTVFAGDLSTGGHRFRRSNGNEATRIEKLDRTLAYFEGRNRLVDEQIAQAIAVSQQRMAALQARKSQNDAEISRVKTLRDQLVGHNIERAENVVTQNVAEELTPPAIVETPTAFTVAANEALPFPQEVAPVVAPQESAPAVMTELPAPMTEVTPSSLVETPAVATAPALDMTPAAAEVPATTSTAEPEIPATTNVTLTGTPQADQGAPVVIPTEEQLAVAPKTLETTSDQSPAIVAAP